jgi:hypothetical protein
MRISALWIVAIGVLAVLFSHSSSAATSDDAKCALPDHLQHEVANRYPEAHIVALSDLGNDDKSLFTKEHGDTCPGLSTVDFYGDGRPAFAISLVSNGEHRKKALLVVAHQVSDSWTMVRIDTADSSTPVVWNDNPGEYTDVYGKKKIRATRPVIVWCAYESWAILYAWTGSTVSKIWISD